MVERTSYSCTDIGERDKYGNFGKPLSKPGKCELCGATVLRLYDEGICLMCKINRTADSSWKLIPRPKSTLFYETPDAASKVLPPPKYGGEKGEGEALSGRTALSEKLNRLSGTALFKPGRCKLCGAEIWTFYDEGICLNCKIKRRKERKAVSKFPELSKNKEQNND